MSERILDGTIKIYETPGSENIRYLFKVPDDLDEPYADLRILTGGGCNNPDISRVKIEILRADKWEDITADSITDPENGEDSTSYTIVFPERIEKGTRLRITILFDDEFESGEYIVFRPSFDDGSVLSSTQGLTATTGELALAIFNRQARTFVTSQIINGRGAAAISDRALAALLKRWEVKGTLERLARVSPDFQELLSRLDTLEQGKLVNITKKGGKGGRR